MIYVHYDGMSMNVPYTYLYYMALFSVWGRGNVHTIKQIIRRFK